MCNNSGNVMFVNHSSTTRLTLMIRRTYFYRRYGLVGELDTANAKGYGCHVIVASGEGAVRQTPKIARSCLPESLVDGLPEYCRGRA